MSYVSPEAQLKADYADLGVSCGYIGNFERWGDDRAFRIFTNLATKPRWVNGVGSLPGYSVSVELTREDGLAGRYDTPENRAKLDALRAKLAAGDLVRR